MKAVQHIIRILVILLVDHTRCQNGFSDRDFLRYQQMAASEGPIEAINSYSTNIVQRDQNSQPISSANVEYHVTDDNNNNRADRTRARKVYRIKNPFGNQEENNHQNEGNLDSQDSGTSASNQYASMQYSLPPEEFLRQMRAENLYYQQQQQTTPAPSSGYTATPQPQFQYSTSSSGVYDNMNQQSNPIPQSEQKSQYLSNNAYQFNPTNTFPFDTAQSTSSPVTNYLSTALPNSQYVGTPSNYVSSSSPIFLSSPSNLQYVSSPLTNIQTGSPDYSGNRVTTTIGSNLLNYDNNDQNKRLHIDHYDNSVNGIRYPINAPQQYQHEYGSSTVSPTSVSYSDSRDTWQSNVNAGVNPLSKSLQEVSLTQYQNFPYSQQDTRLDSNLDSNSETHRIGSMASANNLYLNFAQPEYQTFSNAKSKTRDAEQETGQTEFYSNGEYGWKLSDKKSQINNDGHSVTNSGNYQRYQTALQNNSPAMSQVTFHMDTGRPNNYEQVSKSATDSIEAQEFARAAANAHEYMKQQQSYYSNNNNYLNNYNNNAGTSYNTNPFYGNIEKQSNKYSESSTPSPYLYSPQPDLITASPYYSNSRENSIDNKPKQPFDHAKALKTIVPIDVSNVVSNSESQQKSIGGGDSSRYTLQNYGKEQVNQNQQPQQQQQQQQQYRPITDSYYKDKNSYYGLNIKTKPDEYQSDNLKQFDTNTPFYTKPQKQSESVFNQGYSSVPQRIGYNQQHYLDIQSSSNAQQESQRPQVQSPTDINSILKLNDVPYQLTQTFSPEPFRYQNNDYDRGNLPTQLPMRINQDVTSHQLDVTSNVLSKLLLNKQPNLYNRPEVYSQANNGLSTINGFRVANPFNVDLKLVAEMLKGKSFDNANIVALRDQFNKPATPLKLDLTQLQLLLKNENLGNLSPIHDGLSALSNPFLDVYNSGRYPYQGEKYSRSQEEEEDTIVPIADASNNHPIGAVSEQDDPTHENEASTGLDTTSQGEETIANNYEDERAKKSLVTGHRIIRDRHRHPNSLISGRHSYQRKYPKSEVDEPYPLLKPPPPHSMRGRGSHIKVERQGRKRRVSKPRVFKYYKSEPLFESENENEEESVPITVLRPPPPVAESKSDNVETIEEIS